MHALKQQLRKQLRSLRRQLTHEEQMRYAEKIKNHLIRSTFLKSAHQIALYLPIDGEVSTLSILKIALTQQKSCYVPVLAQTQLQFAKIDEKTPMVKNRYGILEPVCPYMQIIPPRKLDLVLVPLVGFDRDCHRLGMGAGYYDSTFAFKKGNSKPLLIGLAYDFQRVANIPRRKLDVKLDGVVTEKRFYFPIH
ncbi:MAG: 5-formyltetrahydrofolate cyclo-ligase [Proteobacteria bacterium]|nr:5-formyltetrahydrofolate cyclo-ligase [Pseudomonadota bacterium]